jgi:hypothetical protein
LELAVRCALCLEVKEELRLLPCLHSFCTECLTKAAETAPGGKISCALCQVRGVGACVSRRRRFFHSEILRLTHTAGGNDVDRGGCD